MVLVLTSVRRWCGFGSREQVLLVAVPHESALIIHGLEDSTKLAHATGIDHTDPPERNLVGSQLGYTRGYRGLMHPCRVGDQSDVAVP